MSDDKAKDQQRREDRTFLRRLAIRLRADREIRQAMQVEALIAEMELGGAVGPGEAE